MLVIKEVEQGHSSVNEPGKRESVEKLLSRTFPKNIPLRKDSCDRPISVFRLHVPIHPRRPSQSCAFYPNFAHEPSADLVYQMLRVEAAQSGAEMSVKEEGDAFGSRNGIEYDA